MKIPRKKMQCEVPSVAMGDIAFNLLIFFVILAKARDDSHLRWQPAAAQIEKAGQSNASIVVDEKGDLYLNGGPIGQSQLKDALTRQMSSLPAGRRTVLLKVHNTTTASRFQPVIEAASEAGGEMVHILQEKK